MFKICRVPVVAGISFEGEGIERFRDPAASRILAEEGRKAMQKDTEAIEHILAKEGLQC